MKKATVELQLEVCDQHRQLHISNIACFLYVRVFICLQLSNYEKVYSINKIYVSLLFNRKSRGAI